uniref:Pentatricopeptide repeat-containing protein n=1 Tax=Kalanchoe fedtschenkoi TaxID=63787 RepID=A0A7N0VEI1_KALFE
MSRAPASLQSLAKSSRNRIRDSRHVTSLAPRPPPRAGPLQTVTNPQSSFLQNPLYNFLPENRNPNNVVSLICARLKRGSAKVTTFEEDMKDLIPHVGCREVSRVLLRCQSDANTALDFFNWVKGEIGVELSIQNYCIIVLVLVWCKKFSEGMRFLNEMVVLEFSGGDVFDSLLSCSGECVFDEVVFDMVIKAYVKVGKVRDAYVAFGKMGELGFAPNVVAVNCLLNGLARARRDDRCWEVYEEMERIGVGANAFTFNILIRVLCRNGDSSRVNTFLDRMEDEGFDPDGVTYNTLINGYCRRGKLLDALYLYKIMCVRGVMPDLVTYTALMNGHCKVGNPAEAHQLLKTAVERGLSPDIVMYNTLIAGYCKEGKMTDAKALLHSVLGSGVRPDDFTVRVLVEGYVRIGRLVSALNLVEELHRFKLPVPHDVYKFLIVSLCKEDRPFAAKNLFDRSFGDGYKPDDETYSGLISALCRNGRIDDALLLKDDMVYKNCVLNLEAYSAMIGCLSRKGRADEANKVMQNMVESCVRPDSSICRALVTGYCGAGEVEIAESVLASFATEFRIFDTQSFNALVESLAEEGNVDKLMNVQEKMLKLGYTPNTATCKFFISGLQKAVGFRKKCVLQAGIFKDSVGDNTKTGY